MNININNGISTNFRIKPKISKTNKSIKHLYIEVKIYQHGLEEGSVSVSTGSKVKSTEWVNGKVIGRSPLSQIINERLSDYLTYTKNLLNELSLKKIRTCSELKKELETHLKIRVTGKPSRGSKKDFISKLNDYSYESVMKRKFNDNPISEGRKRGYTKSFELLKEFFKQDIPTIDQITTEDLEGFKKWLIKKYNNQNTITDYLSKISAVIKHSLKIKIITVNPLPEKFRGSFVDGKRIVLSENECLKIMSIPDNELSKTEQVSKYCLLVQLLTGMGYSDMKDLEHTNIKYDENQSQYYIEKERNKTGVTFKVFLTENGFFMLQQLIFLTGDDIKPINIPTIDYSLRMYKVIGKKVKIKTNITTYTLRHTFSVDYMEKDGRIEDLQKYLGHSNLKTTQIYGKISKLIIENVLNIIFSQF
jgi:site-specific recombinase XerD